MLPQGARIGVVAPAGIPAAERVASGMATLRSWGYEPIAAPHLTARHRYLAGTTSERHADLRWALTAPDIEPTFSAGRMAELGAKLDISGQAFDGILALIELQNGGETPTYVAGTPNFYVVTRYNWSSYYAMAVIGLGQAVAERMDR